MSFRLAWRRLTELSKLIAAALLALDRTFGDLGAKLPEQAVNGSTCYGGDKTYGESDVSDASIERLEEA
jgi:hypothetical protein